MTKTFYEELELARTATEKEITKAYRRLALERHPDKGGDEEAFKHLGNVYATLSDPVLRARYDATLPPEPTPHAAPASQPPAATPAPRARAATPAPWAPAAAPSIIWLKDIFTIFIHSSTIVHLSFVNSTLRPRPVFTIHISAGMLVSAELSYARTPTKVNLGVLNANNTLTPDTTASINQAQIDLRHRAANALRAELANPDSPIKFDFLREVFTGRHDVTLSRTSSTEQYRNSSSPVPPPLKRFLDAVASGEREAKRARTGPQQRSRSPGR